MILVTGAAGKTGQAVIRALCARRQSVRALIRRSEQGEVLKALGVQEFIIGDLSNQADLARAFDGAHAVYHIAPNMSPDEVAIGERAIESAQAANLSHFVYHSVLHPQTEDMPHHWLKLRVEERIFQSGLSYTILQPAAYMQNILAYWPTILAEGVYRVPYAAETRLSMVDLNDVAAVAATVLTEPGHFGATYELVGPEALSQTEVAAAIGEHLGRTVQVEVLERAYWAQTMKAGGVAQYAVQTLLKMFDYYEQYGFEGNSNVLQWLLDREPTTFREWLRGIKP
ncbi:NmrA family NAD(P)-binding protein [Chloroflexi bacterium TSY]|nr:NmrA family NAD(P)-binding protein [Chloroflexi bacterium TSY]